MRDFAFDGFPQLVTYEGVNYSGAIKNLFKKIKERRQERKQETGTKSIISNVVQRIKKRREERKSSGADSPVLTIARAVSQEKQMQEPAQHILSPKTSNPVRSNVIQKLAPIISEVAKSHALETIEPEYPDYVERLQAKEKVMQEDKFKRLLPAVAVGAVVIFMLTQKR